MSSGPEAFYPHGGADRPVLKLRVISDALAGSIDMARLRLISAHYYRVEQAQVAKAS